MLEDILLLDAVEDREQRAGGREQREREESEARAVAKREPGYDRGRSPDRRELAEERERAQERGSDRRGSRTADDDKSHRRELECRGSASPRTVVAASRPVPEQRTAATSPVASTAEPL